jgi:hypothetical protein
MQSIRALLDDLDVVAGAWFAYRVISVDHAQRFFGI